MRTSELFTAEILTFLAHAAKRDEAKGGIGVRTTREIADHIGTNVALLRRRLEESPSAALSMGSSATAMAPHGASPMPAGQRCPAHSHSPFQSSAFR